MSQEAITALDAAIGQLETELATDPRFNLLTSLKAARAAYGASLSPSEEIGSAPLITTVKRSTVEQPKLAPARAKAFEICRRALVGHVNPVKTRDLYSLVEENGVNLPGGMNNLSSMLGRHPTVFQSHSRAGWTLKGQENGAEPNSAANGDSSATLFNTSQEGGESHEATTH